MPADLLSASKKHMSELRQALSALILYYLLWLKSVGADGKRIAEAFGNGEDLQADITRLDAALADKAAEDTAAEAAASTQVSGEGV